MMLTGIIINNTKGYDDLLGAHIKISNDACITEYFDEKIVQMLEEVNKKNYSIALIDECLLVGVYNRKNIAIEKAFSLWRKGLGIAFPEIDIIDSLSIPIAYPISCIDSVYKTKSNLYYVRKA